MKAKEIEEDQTLLFPDEHGEHFLDSFYNDYVKTEDGRKSFLKSFKDNCFGDHKYINIFREFKINGRKRVKISLKPSVFAMMTRIPIMPTISYGKYNKRQDYKACDSIFGTQNYSEIAQLYADNKVTVGKYQRILTEMNSYALLTSSRNTKTKSKLQNSLVCLDADSHVGRLSHVSENVTKKFIRNVENDLFSRDAVIISSKSQSGNRHFYGISRSKLFHQQTKGLIYNHDNDPHSKFELDVKTDSNYVLIDGAGYGDIILEVDAKRFVEQSKGSLIASTRHSTHLDGDSIFRDLVDFENFTDAQKIQFLIFVAARMYRNILKFQDFDKFIGTRLEMKKVKTFEVKGNNKQERLRNDIEQGTGLKMKSPEEIKSAQARQKAKAQFDKPSIDDLLLSPDVLDSGVTKFNTPLSDLKMKEHYKSAEDVHFTDEYMEGRRGEACLNMGIYLFISNIDKPIALKQIKTLDEHSSSSLIRDGKESEIESKINSAYSGLYHPDKDILKDVLGWDPFAKINHDGDPVKFKRKRYVDLIQIHYNSTIRAILKGFSIVLDRCGELRLGDAAQVTAKELTNVINMELLDSWNHHRKPEAILKVLREIMEPITRFNDYDIYAWFNYKFESNHMSQADVDHYINSNKSELSCNLSEINEFSTKADIKKRAVLFDQLLAENQQVLRYLTMSQVRELLTLDIKLSRGRYGGIKFKKKQLKISAPYVIKSQILSEVNRKKESVEDKLERLAADKRVVRVVSEDKHSDYHQVSYKIHGNRKLSLSKIEHQNMSSESSRKHVNFSTHDIFCKKLVPMGTGLDFDVSFETNQSNTKLWVFSTGTEDSKKGLTSHGP